MKQLTPFILQIELAGLRDIGINIPITTVGTHVNINIMNQLAYPNTVTDITRITTTQITNIVTNIITTVSNSKSI